MIVVLNCSTSWSKNNIARSFTGDGESNDTLVTVPISAIKIANAKMVELKYEKEINTKLRTIIANDSLIQAGLNNEIQFIKEDNNKKLSKIKKQRNIFIGTTIGASLLFLVLLAK